MARTRAPSTPCSAFEANLVLLHYGDLEDGALRELRVHAQACEGCAAYLADLGKLLPLTVKTDDPPEAFWSEYNRELRRKLDASAAGAWSKTLRRFFQRPRLPVFATAAAITFGVALTLGRGFWPARGPMPEDAAILEAMPVAEHLEFFKTMDVLDDLELLEYLDRGARGSA